MIIKNRHVQALFFIAMLSGFNTFAQSTATDSAKLDLGKIFGYCLDGDVTSALGVLETYDGKKFNTKDADFKTHLEQRFKSNTDQSGYLEKRKSPIDDLLKIYETYWRISLLNPTQNYDDLLINNLSAFLADEYALFFDQTNKLPDDTLNVYLKKYIASNGLHTTGFGRTGKYLDLLVWKNEVDTAYSFSVNAEKITTRVVFMDDFVTLGWEEYATMDYAFPGGWATTEALFCVKDAYDLTSEEFLISYLCHEGRHFSDYQLFPKLSSTDLEYRAKLTELSLLNETLYHVIEFFIVTANYDSDNDHSVANYCVIRDLSRILFKTEFEKDIERWKKIPAEKIHKLAFKLLQANTRALQKEGAAVERFIKP